MSRNLNQPVDERLRNCDAVFAGPSPHVWPGVTLQTADWHSSGVPVQQASRSVAPSDRHSGIYLDQSGTGAANASRILTGGLIAAAAAATVIFAAGGPLPLLAAARKHMEEFSQHGRLLDRVRRKLEGK